MAQEGNTGGNQSDAGSKGNAGAGQGNKGKKYLNKYDSIDDAVEQGIGGLEQGFHETRQQLKAIQDLLELAVNPGNDNRGGFAPVGSRSDSNNNGDRGGDYGRGPQAIEDTIDPTEWIASPGKALRRVNEAREQRMFNTMGNFVNQAVAGAMAVSDFKRDNPDLIEHEHIVSHFMKNTDPRKPLDKRLREAAKEARTYIKALRGKGKGDTNDDDVGRSPEGDEFVEGAAGRRDEGEGKGADDKENQDETLDEYIAERRKSRQKHFAPPQRGNS